jgi:redox-sensitive bicupin YhaK (pirin superfamily)
MSFIESSAPVCTPSTGSVELIIRPSPRDLGEFSVARALPAPERRMLGPFIFFDHMGPADFGPGQGIQVRPHPHIGIAAITYLFEGLVIHRDSLGFVQPIEAGAVNLMLAGRGIVHSERAGDDIDVPSHLHGIQSWIALPDSNVECDPAFTHYPADAIPAFEVDGVGLRLIIGEAYGYRSPVETFGPTLYLEARLPADGRLRVPASVPELGAFVVAGEAEIDGQVLASGVMAVVRAGMPIELHALSACRIMLLGGAPVGQREIWWNFVARTPDRIERAKADWKAGRFPRIQGDDEFIPLPE